MAHSVDLRPDSGHNNARLINSRTSFSQSARSFSLQYLPAAEEQAWLFRAVVDLIAKRGHDQFVSMPIVEPTPKFFPDKWNYTPRGLDREIRRLMQYARLEDLDLELATFTQSPVSRVGDNDKRFCNWVAGAFLGIGGGKCRLAFNENAPADAEYMAGVMSHEVTHAYRAHHGLAGASSEEELLTDVTAVFLGFGILVANIKFRVRSYGA